MRRGWLLVGASVAVVLAALLALVDLGDTGLPSAGDVRIANVALCAASSSIDVDRIEGGACSFEETSERRDLRRGFSQAVNWLRLVIDNASDQFAERQLSIGHARMQSVTLHVPAEGGTWRTLVSGTGTPLADKPLPTAEPVFPIAIAPGARLVVYAAIASDTTVDLAPRLWLPEAYRHLMGTVRLMQAAILGALLLAAGFAIVLYARLGERGYLLFAASQLAAAVMDASYTGFLPTTLWPADLPFDIRIQAAASGLTAVLFALFLLDFVPPQGRRPLPHRLLLVLSWAMLAVTVYVCVVDYSQLVAVQALLGVALVLGCVALAFGSWRSGVKPAGYLVVAYVTLAVMLIYRHLVAFGLANGGMMQVLGFAWCFVLVAPTILASVIERSENLRHEASHERAEALARMRLLAQMSHELRSPPNTILGFSNLLAAGSPRTSVQEATAAISSEGKRLLTMIDELLDYARGEVGPLPLAPQPVRLVEFLGEVARAAEVLAAAQGNLFFMDAGAALPDSMELDPQRLRQVLDNLITNAARYTRGGEIVLLCDVEPRGPDAPFRLWFDIIDSGPGIAPSEQQAIFEPFVRGSAASAARHEGAGIGLALSRQLVELMGGSISIVPTENGSHFRFFVIGRPVREAGSSPIELATGSRPGADILVPLRDMVSRGAISDIERWLDRPEWAAHPRFLSELRAAAAGLDFSRLRQLLDTAGGL